MHAVAQNFGSSDCLKPPTFKQPGESANKFEQYKKVKKNPTKKPLRKCEFNKQLIQY